MCLVYNFVHTRLQRFGEHASNIAAGSPRSGCPQTFERHRNSCRPVVRVVPDQPLRINCEASVTMKAAEGDVVTNALFGPIAAAADGRMPYDYSLGLDPTMPISVTGAPRKSATFTYVVRDANGDVATCSVELSIILGEKSRCSCRVRVSEILASLHDLRDDTTASFPPLVVIFIRDMC